MDINSAVSILQVLRDELSGEAKEVIIKALDSLNKINMDRLPDVIPDLELYPFFSDDGVFNKVGAIKAYRTRTGAGLIPAKLKIEEAMRTQLTQLLGDLK